MSSISTLVIYLTKHPAVQYPKKPEAKPKKKAVKIAKAVKIIAKGRKLRNIAKAANFPIFLPFFYHLLCFLKKLHLDKKNL